MMKAVVKVSPEENGTEILKVDVPKPGPNDVIIKIKTVSICGTDVHIYRWDEWAARTIKTPFIYGHEFAGEIVETGSNVKSAKTGDYVSGECHIFCGTCSNCVHGLRHICENLKVFGVDVPGIFAEYACIPAQNIWHNDKTAPSELCSIQDPFGNAVHSVTSADIRGKDVVILGVGPIGAMCVSLCKNMGAKNVIAVEKDNEYRLNLAKSVGADHAILSDESIVPKVKDLTGGKGADVILEMSGSPGALSNGLEMAMTGATVVLLGVYSRPFVLDVTKNIVLKALTLKGIHGRRIFKDWETMKELFKNPQVVKDLTKIITHKFKFDDFHTAMETMSSGKSGKVVLSL